MKKMELITVAQAYGVCGGCDNVNATTAEATIDTVNITITEEMGSINASELLQKTGMLNDTALVNETIADDVVVQDVNATVVNGTKEEL